MLRDATEGTVNERNMKGKVMTCREFRYVMALFTVKKKKHLSNENKKYNSSDIYRNESYRFGVSLIIFFLSVIIFCNY